MTKNSSLPRGVFATSFFQKLMIAAARDPDTSSFYHLHFTVRWGFRITPSVSERTLARVFNKLVMRHDSLRLRFVSVGDDWGAEILPKHPVGLIVDDLSGLSFKDQLIEIETRANVPMTAFSEPMFEMHLLKCGPGGDVILIRAHHAIIDGYSIIVLMEELLKLALNLPTDGGTGSHEIFIQQVERRRQFCRADNDQYWEELLLPAPEPLRIGRVAMGLPQISRHNVERTHVLTDILSEPESKSLEAFSKSAGVTPFAAVQAAFGEAICDLAGQDEVIICSWIGRQDASLRNFIGCDLQVIAQKYQKTGMALSVNASKVASVNQEAAQRIPSDILLPDSSLVRALAQKGVTPWRFAVHNSLPSGRLSNSPFKKLFLAGLEERVSVGPLSIKRLELPKPCEAEFEILVQVNYLPSGPNVTIIADIASYELKELEQIVTRLKAELLPEMTNSVEADF